jgi:hypothetical protein
MPLLAKKKLWPFRKRQQNKSKNKVKINMLSLPTLIMCG